MAFQLLDYIDSNGLCEVCQSAYPTNHSTETALIRVYNDIALSIDSRKSVVLVLLDLSAAFDTVDHFFLLSRLSARFGISDHALNWLRSYLSDRTQFVRIQGVSSHMNDVPMEFLKVPCWVLCYIHCIRPHWVTLQDLMARVIIFMRMIRSYIYPLKRHLLMICLLTDCY